MAGYRNVRDPSTARVTLRRTGAWDLVTTSGPPLQRWLDCARQSCPSAQRRRRIIETTSAMVGTTPHRVSTFLGRS